MFKIPEYECPKCKNPECKSTDAFCFNCGHEIRNYCTNPDCKLGGAKDPSDNVLPRHYCHCSMCGQPTRYFRNGIITPAVFDSYVEL